jgi:alpha-L-fucosidase 2
MAKSHSCLSTVITVQIDGNGGTADARCCSSLGFVELRCSSPGVGEVKGLVARGGFVVDIAWKNGNVISAKVHSNKGGTCRLKYGKKLVELETVEGEDYELEELI